MNKIRYRIREDSFEEARALVRRFVVEQYNDNSGVWHAMQHKFSTFEEAKYCIETARLGEKA